MKKETEREEFLCSFLQGDWAVVVVVDSRAEIRLKTENNSSSVPFILTRAEERSDLVEESSDWVELSCTSVLVTRIRAEESSDLVEESSVKFTMETNPP